MNIRTSYQTRNIVNYNRNQRYLRSKANPNSHFNKQHINAKINTPIIKMSKKLELRENKNSFIDKIINIYRGNKVI